MTNHTDTPRVRGVALIVSNPSRKIMLLQERETKVRLGKHAGMFSPPMETCCKGESDVIAVLRLIEEELPRFPGHIEVEQNPRGVYQVVSSVWASLYVGYTESSSLPIPVEGPVEVGGHLWIPPHEALMLWLRQGAFEMLSDYTSVQNRVVRQHCRPVSATPPHAFEPS